MTTNATTALNARRVQQRQTTTQRTTVSTFTTRFCSPGSVVRTTVANSAHVMRRFRTVRTTTTFPTPPIPCGHAVSGQLVLLDQLTARRCVAKHGSPHCSNGLRRLLSCSDDLSHCHLIAGFQNRRHRIGSHVRVRIPRTLISSPNLVSSPATLRSALTRARSTVQSKIATTIQIKQHVRIFCNFLLRSRRSDVLIFQNARHATR